MFCAQCGNPVFDQAHVCNRCGAAAAMGSAGSAGPFSGASGDTSGMGAALSRSQAAKPRAGLVGRIGALLASPAAEWPIIAAEPASPAALYLGYAAPLIAVGVVATFIGQSVVGLPFAGRVGPGTALGRAIVACVLAFLAVFLLALAVDLLAPRFAGRRDALAALKLTVYSFTPAWLAGIVAIVPILAPLTVFASLYGLYLLYLGLPVLMRCPAERVVSYGVATALCAIAIGATIALIGIGTTAAIGR
ncbi:MAG TPA: YIP1 family protein [Casimicrobiaceae bacterium]|nr:YIP1 family protein [Casimicrobiaceae bacterium]